MRVAVACAMVSLANVAASATAAADETVATIGKQPITAAELDKRLNGKLSALQAEYDKRTARLKIEFDRQRQTYRAQELTDLVNERLLSLEAAAQKTTPQTLLAKLKAAPVTDADVKSFYDAKRSQIDQPFNTVAPLIKQYLEKDSAQSVQTAYFQTLRVKYNATENIAPSREAVAPIGPQRGPNDAAVTLVEFSDFQCPYCGHIEPALREVLRKYPRQVRLVYRQFPLENLHPQAQKAAEASLCAHEQGKFWEMHDALFADQNALALANLKDKAKKLGLDSKAFDQCLDSGKTAGAVKADLAAGELLGIDGTPATFVNGRFINGAVTAQDLGVLVDDELRRAAPAARR